MQTSQSVSKIAAALVQAQKAITFAHKDATNPHFKNKYADLGAVIEAVKQHLNDAGIAYIQSPSPSEVGHLALTTRLLHESGEWLEDTATLPLPKNDPQGYGSAMTYARRYALSAITGLYQDDDDGTAASAPRNEPPKAAGRTSLTDREMDDVKLAMHECADLEVLKGIFASAYTKANTSQQAELKTAYDKQKDYLTTRKKA